MTSAAATATAAAAAATAASATAKTAVPAVALPLRLRRRPQQQQAPSSSALLASASTSASAAASTSSSSASTHQVADEDFASTKNVVVLGGSYGGMHAATVLASKLPPSHRVILVDRNSHFNHLYVFPRFSILPGHEHKAFIPYTSIFKNAPNRTLKAKARGTSQSDRQAYMHNDSANEPTFDLEMGSCAAPDRSTKKTAASSPTRSSASSSSSSSYSASPTEDDFTDEARSDSSYSSENITSVSGSSLLFDRNKSGPHSARSFGSTISSVYSAEGDSTLQPQKPDSSTDKLASQLKAQASIADGEQTQTSVTGATLEYGASQPLESNSTDSASQTPVAATPTPLHVKDELPPAKAVHEQDELGRQPMKVEVAEGDGAAADGMPAASANTDEHAAASSASGYDGAPPHMFIQGSVTDIKPDHVLVDVFPTDSSGNSYGLQAKSSLWNITSRSVRIPYTHLIYALGSHLPDPLRTEARTKSAGREWMKEIQERVEEAEDIVLVGGGALGVQFASDIASVHGTISTEPHPTCRDQAAQRDPQQKKKKRITLIHSRKQLLPNFDERIHEIALKRLTELGVNVVLGERLALTDGCPMGSTLAEDRVPFPRPAAKDGSAPASSQAASNGSSGTLVDVRQVSAAELSKAANRPGRKIVRTTGGKLFHADVLLLCTGQQPNSGLLAKLSPSSVDPRTRLVKVRRTLQVERLPGTEGWGGVLEVKAPCGDCDCFMDRKVESEPQPSGHVHTSQCECGAVPGADVEENADEEAEDRSRCIPNVYAIGDVADAFGALNAGYQAWAMADIAAENVLRDLGVGVGAEDGSVPSSGNDGASVTRSNSTSSSAGTITSASGAATSKKTMMRRFKPVAPMLKLSLGLGTMAWQGAPIPHHRSRTGAVTSSKDGGKVEAIASEASSSGATAGSEEDIVMRPEVMEKEDPYDLGVEGVWKFMANADTEDLYL
ncbi:hypothetical protein OC846_006269 [Tilletia horrida]|uniref:FAD/NAD(P)-binding domain-containing protein n=1 Tax=Tilletia horrida TaxID=155126 RepID=A0AAN6GJ54_9BASI|nr:hypothetical protein OC846_006269 [Tilletia horrida]KAK0551443.1 hypothetical protein OC845_002155 [Tilletia horrida]KAK0569802.1 hypothetical protein OC861_000513 [Tilletia horrida]